MSELLPCPFCGGEANIQVSKRWPDGAEAAVDGYTAVCQNIDCILGGNDEWWADTEAEAIEAWNTRAERTCQNVDDHKTVWFICSMCGYQQKLSHTRNYCPNCGAKVVDE